MIITFPAISVFSGPDVDPELMHREQAEHIPGLHETFETKDPAMPSAESNAEVKPKF